MSKFNPPHIKKQKNQSLFSLENTKLPKDTREIGLKLIDNFSLRLNKAVQFDKDDKEGKPRFFHKTKHEKIDILAEKNLVNTLKNIAQKYANQYKHWIKKYADLEIPDLTLPWRLIVGLGNPSVYETSMTLHHIYGIPYLPGSAIKGVTRSYCILKMAEGLKDAEKSYYERVALLEKFLETFDLINQFPEWDNVKKIKIDSPDDKKKKIGFSEQMCKALKDNQTELQKFQLIFGTQDRQGCIVFFDTFPEDFEIKYDVMNPHYGDYYTKEDKEKYPPADYYNPTPIPFLVLEKAKFTFHLGLKPRHILLDIELEQLLKAAETWVKQALTEHGIGAKTAIGYGYFDMQK